MKKGFLTISREIIPNITNIQNGVDVEENFSIVEKEFSPIIEKLIKKVAFPKSIEYDDLMQEGRIALWHCCYKYDLNSEASFYTYFSSTALKALSNYVYKYQLPITVNRHEMEKTKTIRAFSKEFFNINGEKPVLKDYIEAGFPQDLAERFCLLNQSTFTPMHEHIEEIEKIESEESVEELAISKINSEILYDALNQLDERRREIIIMHCIEGKTYKEIKEKIGISITYIRVYQKEGFEMLKAIINDKIK